MIGSHNSMSYKTPKKWYHKLIFWAARCQSCSIISQFTFYNVRLFDFRIRFDKNGDLTFAHGPIEFHGDVTYYLTLLNKLAEHCKDPVYCRVILESNGPMKDQDLQEEHFKYFCEDIETDFKNVKFFGGNRKYDWKRIYNFKQPDISLDDKYSSTTIITGPNRYDFWAKLDDLWPWLYAKLHNRKNILNGTDKECLFIDFVNIY